ncbi:MAG TPA: family 78 glycoside hydrolase catalytic domain [Tepidisphaeraceae bacterium]|jgi:hypothetical protein|nr:family 78 glycoside hydrolase catalytic domain [Tepidisphaeraceae bacterium]
MDLQTVWDSREGHLNFDANASWIWVEGGSREYNAYIAFRREFDIEPGAVAAGRLRITADARYEVYVNGVWVGHGPVRSWPHIWGVDEYDVRHLLRAGRNVIAVLVTHYGLSTFQYIHAEAGLLAQLDWVGAAGGSHRLVTDRDWRARIHDGFAWPVPRVSCQQGWEEQFDARQQPGLIEIWGDVGYDDRNWAQAAITHRAGEGTHQQFELGEIPALTRENTQPARVRNVEAVRTAAYQFTLYPRDMINHIDKSANHVRGRMLLLTHIFSDVDQEVELHPPHDRPATKWKLNGKELLFADHSPVNTMTGVERAKLKAGWNVLMAKLPEMEHLWWGVINIRSEKPLKFAARRDEKTETAWIAYGPFAGASLRHMFDTILVDPLEIHPDATAERFAAAWERGHLRVEEYAAPFCRVMKKDLVATNDVYALGTSERVVKDVPARVDHRDALMEDNDDWTIIYPADHADMRILLDFGKEVVGFQEFEIDAPAGAMVDVHNFEFIQRDGRINLAESMNNSFRYTCREGAQRYRTFIRRGFRYSWMSFRNFSRPIRVRFVRVIMSTYPLTRAGEFACSDAMLNQIWEVGVYSVRCCSEDTYTDCPSYEQTLWVGDARNEALVDLVANGDPRLSQRSLRLTGRSLDRSPIVESQVPSGWQNILTTWCSLWMRWCHEHFMLTGDEAFGQELLGYVERNVKGMRDHINGDGLFEMIAWNLFDWAPMDTPARGVVTHVQCAAVQGLHQCADLARRLGNTKLAKSWTQFAEDLTKAVNKHLWSDKKQAYFDCIREGGTPSPVFSQQTQTAAYISGVATGKRAERCRKIVHKAPAGFVEAGSPFFMFFLLEALVREEEYDALIQTIRTYWGEQVAAGATSFWEMYHPDEPRLTRSHCHGWSAAPVAFLTQNVLGVQPLTPGYEKVLIAPHPGDLEWAQGRVPTPRGVVQCTWKNKKDSMELEILAPESVGVQIELPFKGHVTVATGKVKAGASPMIWIGKGPVIRLSVAKRTKSKSRKAISK